MKKAEKARIWDKPFIRGLCLALIIVPLIIFEYITRTRLGIKYTAQTSLWYIYSIIVMFAFLIPYYERLVRWQTRWMSLTYRNAENLEPRPIFIKIGKAILYFFYIAIIALAVAVRMLFANI